MKKRTLAFFGIVSAITGFQLGLYGDKRPKVTLNTTTKEDVSLGTEKKWDSTHHTQLVNGTTTDLCRRDFPPRIIQYPHPHRCHFKGRFPLPG